VGSNPTRSTFVNLVEYGIVLSSFSVIVGQIQQQCAAVAKHQQNILPCTTSCSFTSNCCYLFAGQQL
jgi:hypothetical protein